MITHPGPIEGFRAGVDISRRTLKAASFRGEVVHPAALKLRDDRHALGHEESGRPLPGQSEDAEARSRLRKRTGAALGSDTRPDRPAATPARRLQLQPSRSAVRPPTSLHS